MKGLAKTRFEVAFGGAADVSSWRPDTPAPPGPAPVANDDESLRGSAALRRVLIVEDEVVIAMTLESYVEDLGLEVCGVAATGADAVEMARSLRPDLILMDVTLIGAMDGIEAAQIAREAIGARIVFVTAYGSGEIMNRIRAAVPGAPVVPKPVNLSVLRRAIEAVGSP